MMFFSWFCKADAYIASEYDIQRKVEQLQQLSEFDFLSLINKNELIGYRLDSFNMSCMFYSNSVRVVAENLNNILKQIELVKNSSDYSDTEKNMQISKLYQNADTALFELDSKTMSYLMDIRMGMPTITYDRYVKKFREYYNSLDLTGATIETK